VQAIDGVPKISQDYNPATWMLEITNTAVENRTGQDFAALYANSDMNKCVESAACQVSAYHTFVPPDVPSVFIGYGLSSGSSRALFVASLPTLSSTLSRFANDVSPWSSPTGGQTR